MLPSANKSYKKRNRKLLGVILCVTYQFIRL